jgi:hypothetical protein
MEVGHMPRVIVLLDLCANALISEMLECREYEAEACARLSFGTQTHGLSCSAGEA